MRKREQLVLSNFGEKVVLRLRLPASITLNTGQTIVLYDEPDSTFRYNFDYSFLSHQIDEYFT
jgi:hypothetical protein